MNALATALPATFAFAEKVAPILIDAITKGVSKEELRAQLHAAADEFVETIVGASGRIEADDQSVLEALEAFRRGG